MMCIKSTKDNLTQIKGEKYTRITNAGHFFYDFHNDAVKGSRLIFTGIGKWRVTSEDPKCQIAYNIGYSFTF